MHHNTKTYATKNDMKTIEEKITPAIFPTDINGVQVNIGDKVRGFGYISFQDGWQIDRTPIVTANIQGGHLMFGNLSCESFDKFEIIQNENSKIDRSRVKPPCGSDSR